MVVGGAIRTTTKRWFIIRLLAHALRDPQFDDGFRKKWLSSNTLAHLLCTHYDITVQDLKFDGNTLLEVTSDLNKAKLSSAGIGDINQEEFSANESGIFSIRSRSSMGGYQKFFYLKSVDSIKRATESEVVPVRKSRRRSLQRSWEKQEEELILPQPQSSCPEWLASMVQQETSILLNPPLAIKIPIPLDRRNKSWNVAFYLVQT